MGKIFPLVTLLVLLLGCAEQNIIEEVAFIHSVAYDLNKDEDKSKRLTITVSIPQTAQDAVEDREVISVQARSVKDGRTAISRKTDRMLGNGQLRSALFSEELGKEGFIDILESLVRDHHIGINLRIILVEGTGKEVLTGEYTRYPRTGRYITNIVEKETEESIAIDTTLHQFNRDYYDDGIDPICAIIKKGENEIILDGIALFNGDKFVMKVSPVDGRTFKMIHGSYRGGNVSMPVEDGNGENGSYLTFSTIHTKRKIKALSPDHVQIEVDLVGTLDEYIGHLDLSTTVAQRKLEEQISNHLKKEAEGLLAEMQEKKDR
ncbi:MAG: Ger(x)C family spore germination protein [Bacillus sp. (in: Bacteria)]|nr:Ger(x)C family spore germination protein [Bacillus sp. (in: firmicutes)]